MRLAGHLVPRNASDRFQLGILRPFASTFAAYFLPARILRTLVVPGAVAYKSISSRSIIVTTPSSHVACGGAHQCSVCSYWCLRTDFLSVREITWRPICLDSTRSATEERRKPRRHTCALDAAADTPLCGPEPGLKRGIWSGRRGSNPRPRPWQGRALPLSYTRIRNRWRSDVAIKLTACDISPGKKPNGPRGPERRLVAPLKRLPVAAADAGELHPSPLKL